MTVRTPSRILLITLIFFSCNKFADPDTHYVYAKPDAASGFISSSLTDEDMDVRLIEQLTDHIVHEDFKRIDGLLILKNDHLVYENYFHGYDADVPHNIYSSSKSIISLLVGIAIERHFIENVNVPILQLLPEYSAFNNPDSRKESITIENLLNMSSGFACDDWFSGTENMASKSNDHVKFTLDLPMANDPGTSGHYCTGNVWILQRIIENSSKMSFIDFTNKFLFESLDITNYKWIDNKFFLTPRDMAKIGLLIEHEGYWNNLSIVNQSWIQSCKTSYLKLPGPFEGYGYLWWKQTLDNDVITYFSSGNGGQDIFIIPHYNLVVVFTTGNKNTDLGLQNIEMLRKYIIPANL